ncbi:hypothetical protein D9619_008667 [Psilocybe cf. subviscida]|uniref:Protein kinase domain-containing protein n=1 Tax=Psilocybe cf. subviscida TaxID=2480587 RepID=A0A8H5BAC5_9AGAR|nr:hypothetical protein D9619_008667 [Psilocybe cf. subviscida]
MDKIAAAVLKVGQNVASDIFGPRSIPAHGFALFRPLSCDSAGQPSLQSVDDGASVVRHGFTNRITENSYRRVTIGVNQTMSQNPCRRYIYGLTFNGGMLTFWRFDRGAVVMSEPFDYQQPAESQLDHPSFVYQLEGRRYRTIGPPIYSSPENLLCSRAAIVWSVKEVDEDDYWLPDTEEHVLKDFWADEDHPKEAECQRAIKHKLQVLDLDGGDRAQAMDAYFLNIWHEEDITINGASSSPLTSTIRIHRRRLFEEKCIRLTESGNISQMLHCMKQFSVGLDLFRQAAYVHRDISVGNCLIHERNGVYHTKICDLKFCKEYTSISFTDPVTGTRDFMAIELFHGYNQFSEMITEVIAALPKDQVVVRSICQKLAKHS